MSELNELKVEPGGVLTARLWNALVSLVARALEGPEVVSPLIRRDGAIGLGQDYQVYNAKTTGVVAARSGAQWGSGTAAFYTVSSSGVESVTLGYAAFTAWNYFGAPIASGIRIQVCWTYEKWVILGGDCSGVA